MKISVFGKASKDLIPYFILIKDQNYGYIEYDMATTFYLLNEDAVSNITKLFNELLLLNDDGAIYVNYESGRFPLVPLNICQNYASKVAEIIFNKQNWYCHPAISEYELEYFFNEINKFNLNFII